MERGTLGERGEPGWAEAWRLFRRGLAEKIAPGRLRDDAALAGFVGTRAAKVAQAALFGYLKTRMGTQARNYFQDDAFAPAIEAAQRQVFFACAADLAIYALGQVATGRALPAATLEVRARRCFAEAATVAYADAGPPPADRLDAFAARVRAVDWSDPPDAEAAFAESARVLVASVPVSHAYRAADADIVDASIRYRWIEVRRELRRRLDPEALAGIWTASAPEARPGGSALP